MSVAERIAQMNSLNIDDGRFAALGLGPTGVEGVGPGCVKNPSLDLSRGTQSLHLIAIGRCSAI